MSSFYWLDIGISDRVFEVGVNAGHAKVAFLDALASLDLKLSVSQSVIDTFSDLL